VFGGSESSSAARGFLRPYTREGRINVRRSVHGATEPNREHRGDDSLELKATDAEVDKRHG
jgi:hypothetical protein